MRLALVTALVLIGTSVTLPAASAQSPVVDEAVTAACATLDDLDADELLPLCPHDPPASPAPARPSDSGGGDDDLPPPAGDPDAIDTPEEVTAEVVVAIEKTLDDPEGAPGRLEVLVVIVVDFAQRLLSLPGDLIGTLVDAVASAADTVVDTASAAVEGVRDACLSAWTWTVDAAVGIWASVTSAVDRPDVGPPEIGDLPQADAAVETIAHIGIDVAL